VLARLAAQADVEAPELLVAHARAANALAAFRPGKRSAVIVTTGLLQRLNPAELEAVLAHELSHLTDRDAAVMTVVGGPALACSALWHARNGRASSIAILLSPLWLVALLLMLVVARGREYAADRGSALLTGRPEQLISALTKLHGLEPQGDLRGGTAVRALCIVGRHASRIPLLRDPPIEKRIAALEEIARELGQPSRPGWTGH
jgi:heat shock protein HtpX